MPQTRLLFIVVVAAVLQVCALAADARPNIVVVMVDDMGFSDLGCYGGEIATPNIDRLAGSGMRFTRFYNNAKCEPSRASLLTGKYSQQVGASATVTYRSPTMGEVLRPAGYRTLMVGKWHAGQKPFDRGFDRHYGLTDGCCNYFNPGVQRDGEPKPSEKNFPRRWAEDDKDYKPYTPADPKFYATDAFTTYAINYLDQYKAEDKPFLLYVAYNAPHYPLHAWPEDIAKYKGKYMKGWDALRQERFERQVKSGLLAPGTKLSPRDAGVLEWESLTQTQKEEWDLRMAVYAAMVDRIDQNIGRLLKKIDELGKTENTLVLFLSDNGGEFDDTDYSNVKSTPPGPLESYRMVGKPWANANNTPFRKYKTFHHEGGIATPLIACWPKLIKAGVISEQPGHLIDLLPTFIEMAGADYPKTWAGKALDAPAGRSLLPVFKGEARPTQPIFWNFGAAAAVQNGDWKLVRAGKQERDWELYNLSNDRTELNNLAAQQPEKVKELSALWNDWRKRVNDEEAK
ncbi:MAG TPA: arylsulfatase [Planctomycetota bacterium]|nr:arylsulfatase [Planctomycetota bacterium]